MATENLCKISVLHSSDFSSPQRSQQAGEEECLFIRARRREMQLSLPGCLITGHLPIEGGLLAICTKQESTEERTANFFPESVKTIILISLFNPLW